MVEMVVHLLVNQVLVVVELQLQELMHLVVVLQIQLHQLEVLVELQVLMEHQQQELVVEVVED